jgi:hypothetical protein
MAPESQNGFEQLLTEQIGSLVHTVADLPGMTEDQQAAKQQSVTGWLLSFQPRDGIEIMLASHCVIYDHLLKAGAREFSRTPSGPLRQRAQPGILATGKMFLNTLNILLRKQGRATIRAAATATSRTATPEAPPRETAQYATPSPTPGFATGPVDVPRDQQPADPARFGAAFRQRHATMPFADRPPAAEFNLPRHLSHASMLAASGMVDLRRVTPAPPPKTSKVKAKSATKARSGRLTSKPGAAPPRYAQPTTAIVAPRGRAPPV